MPVDADDVKTDKMSELWWLIHNFALARMAALSNILPYMLMPLWFGLIEQTF